MRQNIEELPDVVRLASHYGADRVIVGDLREYEGMEGQRLVDDWDAAEPYYREAAAVAKVEQIDFCPSDAMQNRLQMDIIAPRSSEGVCKIPWTTAFIDVNGMVRPCCVVDESLGDLNTQTLDEAWNGERAHAFRESFANGIVPDICKQCTWKG
jgi:radical SAM protein with 4Fe4S-binding SPASM domain